jgi:hypothetical protein
VPQNYFAGFRGPNVAEIDRAAYGNALLKNEVDRAPQRNRAEDLAIQAQDQQLGQNRSANARKMAADIFSAIADSPDPISTGAMLTQSQAFRDVGAELKLPVDQFRPVAGDDPEQIRAAARSWAQAVGANAGQQQRVQSTQVLEDGTIAYVTADGQLVRTGEKARNPLQIVPGGVGGAPAAFNRQGGQITPLSTPAVENQAAADRAAATTTATTTAQASAEMQNVQRANERTLGVWQVARQGLVTALRGTETGPIAGRMPALTAGQQIAEGAVAAVAPVLKQLFRSAGEGVFTDRDQQLLLDMIPTRNDHPESAVAKIGMIDAIIEAKLSAGAGAAAPPGGAPSVPVSDNDPLGLFK